MPISIVDIPKKLFGKSRKEEEVKKALQRYFKVVEGAEKPKSKLLDKETFRKKITQSNNILKSCKLCERNCLVNRLSGKKGYCQLGKDMLISSFFEHHGEEHFFIPPFTIFFWSCNFSCQYCQNYTISQRLEEPHKMTEDELAEIIDEHVHCKNVNLVGGEPTLQLPSILKILFRVKRDVPIIWNSNFYMSEKSMELLKDVIDVYLSDFKYGNDGCAKRLSKIDNYTEIVKRNHILAKQDAELVIRHLVLPGHIDCCTKPILNWIAKTFGKNVIVNIMDQYKPDFHAVKYPEIARYLTSKEFKDVVNYAKKLKLNFIY